MHNRDDAKSEPAGLTRTRPFRTRGLQPEDSRNGPAGWSVTHLSVSLSARGARTGVTHCLVGAGAGTTGLPPSRITPWCSQSGECSLPQPGPARPQSYPNPDRGN